MIQPLSETAHAIEQIFDEKLLDDKGILRSMLKLNEMRPLCDSDFTEKDLLAEMPGYGVQSAGFFSYENTGMVQGTYLSAMCFKYQATDDPDALEKARRTYQGICKVYDMSQEIAPGFMCKPWDGKVSDETSSDQYVYVLYGLDDYYGLATSEEQKQIRTMIVAMVRFWLDHHYDWKYYGEPLHWQEHRFIAFMALAVKYGGGVEFEREQERLTREQSHAIETPFHATLQEQKGMPWNGKLMYSFCPENALSCFLSLEAAMRTKNCPRFMEIGRDAMTSGKIALAGDGTCYAYMYKDPVNGQFHEMDPRESTYKSNRYQSPIWGLTAPYRRGGMQTTIFSRFLLMYEKYAPDCGCSDLAEDLLRQVGTEHLTWFEDPHHVFPDEIKWMTNMFNSDAAAHWLWSYWKLYLNKKRKA